MFWTVRKLDLTRRGTPSSDLAYKFSYPHHGLFTVLQKSLHHFCLWASSHSIPHTWDISPPSHWEILPVLQRAPWCNLFARQRGSETQITLYQGQGLSLVPCCEGGREGTKLEALTLPSFSLLPPWSHSLISPYSFTWWSHQDHALTSISDRILLPDSFQNPDWNTQGPTWWPLYGVWKVTRI